MAISKYLFLIGGLVLLPVSAATPLEADLAARLGNTIIATDPDGTATHMYWKADHTVEVWRTGPKAAGWKGAARWEAKNGQLCLTYTPPRPGIGQHECMKPGVHHAGETWHAVGRTITMVKGRQ